jgi:hypothetical protein
MGQAAHPLAVPCRADPPTMRIAAIDVIHWHALYAAYLKNAN